MSELKSSRGANHPSILLKTLILSMILGQTYGAGRRLNYNFSLQRTENAVELANGTVNNYVARKISEFRVAEDDLFEFFSYDVGFRIENPDYSTVTITDANGRNEFLSDIRPENDEHFLDTRFALAKGQHTLTFGASSHLGDVAFKRQSANIGYNFSIYNKSSVFGVVYNWRKDGRQETYFVNPVDTTRYIKRPTNVVTKAVTLTYDQIFTERIKTYAQYTHQMENNERPGNVSVGLKAGYVFTDQLFGKIGYTYSAEDKNDPIKNDRGYFTAHGLETEITWEPIFDLLLSFSYDLVWEDEDFPVLETINRIGFDQYGIGARYLYEMGLAQTLKASYVETNQGLDAFNITGGLEWEF